MHFIFVCRPNERHEQISPPLVSSEQMKEDGSAAADDDDDEVLPADPLVFDAGCWRTEVFCSRFLNPASL